MQEGLAWSQETAAAYRAAVAEETAQDRGFVPVGVVSAPAAPRVLRLMDDPDRRPVPQGLDVVLGEQSAALVGATGMGKSAALRYLARTAAQQGRIPVLFDAFGHTTGALPRRVRYRIEALLKRPLTAGAVSHILAAQDLLLLVDGVSEVSAATRASLAEDLSQLAAQRPVQVIATGRDLPLTADGAALPDSTAVFQMTGLGHDGRRELATAHGGGQAVRSIEHQLGSATENPQVFLMALSLLGDGIPRSRAETYEQFVRGLTALAKVAEDDVGLAALGAAWAAMIGEGQRTADHYTWRLALGTALDQLAAHPAWRGHSGTPETALQTALRTGLLTRHDPDSGLEPLHDSFADFLAARAIVRREASLPPRLSATSDETVTFMIEIAGLDHTLALRLATENPLLCCRVAQQQRARGRAHAGRVSQLVRAMAGGLDLPLIAGAGIKVCDHDQFTGAVLAGENCQTVDVTEFAALAGEHPAIMLPASAGSMQVAVTLWALAVERAHRPDRRLFQPPPPADPNLAAPLLTAYLQAVRQELHRLASVSLPATIRDRVLTTIGSPGIIAYIGDPVPGPLGGTDIPVYYRRGTEHAITRGQPPPGFRHQAMDTLGQMIQKHPSASASGEISLALSALTGDAWPVP